METCETCGAKFETPVTAAGLTPPPPIKKPPVLCDACKTPDSSSELETVPGET